MTNQHLKQLAVLASLIFISVSASAGSLYLPVNLSPEIEARIERLFVIANMPIIKRPIPVKQVQLALKKAADRDSALTSSIREYLSRYSHTASLTHVSISAAADSGVNYIEANNRGYGTGSNYQISVAGYWAVNDRIALNVGGIIGQRPVGLKNKFPEGTFLSLGWDHLQADIGYRSHWWGPFQESDMLFSTQASALPSVTLSNVVPLRFLGISYEVFFAQMSESDGILSQDRTERLVGKPRLFGTHISFAPVDGFAIGFNRILQYGGADRDSSFTDLAKAFLNAKKSDNIGNSGNDFGNQLSSITTKYTSSGEFPVSIYMEYAAEDTSRPSSVHFGNSALMFGVHLPKLTNKLDLTWETAEWQNAWYVNSNYSDGYRQHQSIIGHWGGEQRVTGDGVGASAQTLKLIWDISAGRSLTMKYRQIENKDYSGTEYETGNTFSAEYAQSMGNFITGLKIIAGNTVSGEDFSQFSGFIRW